MARYDRVFTVEEQRALFSGLLNGTTLEECKKILHTSESTLRRILRSYRVMLSSKERKSQLLDAMKIITAFRAQTSEETKAMQVGGLMCVSCGTIEVRKHGHECQRCYSISTAGRPPIDSIAKDYFREYA